MARKQEEKEALIGFAIEGDVALITLNRPDKLNAFCVPMHELLLQAMKKARDDNQVRAVLLTGAGRGFCAGQDLQEQMPSQDGPQIDLGATLEDLYNPIIRLIRDMPKPVVCAVNGIAAGAGVNLALACDIVLAASSARFIQAFAKIGLLPDSGGTYLLPAIIGEARAKALALLGNPISAEQAEQWGMIWRIVADADLMDEARALANELAQGSMVSADLIKRAIHLSHNNSLSEQLDLERDYQREAGQAGDYAEGVDAFTGKRAPKFSAVRN